MSRINLRLPRPGKIGSFQLFHSVFETELISPNVFTLRDVSSVLWWISLVNWRVLIAVVEGEEYLKTASLKRN